MDKALEAGARALYLIHCDIGGEKQPTLYEHISPESQMVYEIEARAVLDAASAALPAPDTSGLVERLRTIDEEAMYEAPATSEVFIREAADYIEALERRLAEAEAVIRPFANIANAVFRVDDGREMNAHRKDEDAVWGFDRTELTYGHLRRARSYLEGRK